MSKSKKHAVSEYEDVRTLIREAFPDVNQRPDLTELTHEDSVYWRSRLAMLRTEDHVFFLAQVLLDLLGPAPGNEERKDVDLLILHLDVPVNKGLYGEREGRKSLHNDLVETYKGYNAQQAHAIFRWLEVAEGWPELSWDTDIVQSARDYWRDRAMVEENQDSKSGTRRRGKRRRKRGPT